MGLVDLLLQSGSGALLDQVAKTAGTDNNGAKDLLSTLGSALLGQVKGRVEGPNDSSGLEALIKESKFQDMLDHPSEHLNNSHMVDNGNDILSYITGSKEGSREVAASVAGKTGFDFSAIKSLLPVLAPFILGSLGKGMASSNVSSSSASNSQLSGLMGILDFDNDGSVIDDVASLAMRFLR